MNNKIIWTTEHDDALMTLLGLEENLTFTVIAQRMAEQFALPFTRNSCIGRAHRLKMPPRPEKPIKDPKKRKPREKVVAMPVRIDAPIPPKEAYRPRNGRDLTIYQLGYGDCRWPEGNQPPLSYCGETAEDGRPYCFAHCEIAYHTPYKRWR